ncbi:reverse transcriptase domain-containing protein, partial [Mesorhizobium sp.]|uniref:reverse transcriptase domain-containing protein n=1 Tax=Mesorhizobium sp. TaxID=1871066 RepID=UPI00345BCB94
IKRNYAIEAKTTFCVRGVSSPLLANIYLHYCFDLWAERWRRREASGDMIIVRYADDLVLGFERERDARRFLDAMRARLEEFALSSRAGSANRRPSHSWDLPSSAKNPAKGASCLKGRPAATACGRSSRTSR